MDSSTPTSRKRRATPGEVQGDKRKGKKWSKEEETAMADYIRENYERFKVIRLIHDK